MPLFDTWWKIAILIGSLAVLRIGAQYLKWVRESARKGAIEFLDSALLALLLVFLLIRPFIMQAYWIPSDSMLPTLHRGDRILVLKFTYRLREPKRKEIVVFRAPPAAANGAKKDFIKRVIAVGGDTIAVRDNEKTGQKQVFINGKPVNEPFIREPMTYPYGPTRVPRGKLFVMGDNRNDSNDSHHWGFLPRPNLEGKAVLRFWPLTRIGPVR
jgi:signal peptidase I